jgi:hypothetical protein
VDDILRQRRLADLVFIEDEPLEAFVEFLRVLDVPGFVENAAPLLLVVSRGWWKLAEVA